MFLVLGRSLAFAAALLAADGALALGFAPEWGTYGAPMAQFLHSNYTMQQLANGSFVAGPHQGSKKATAASASPASTEFQPAKQSIAPHKLALAYPAASRDQAQRFFEQTLDGYHKIESQFGLRRNDLAGAFAAFVAGNYIAYRDLPFPDQYFKPLVAQLRATIGEVGALRQASNTEKQEIYEHLAILGTYMALTRDALSKSPDPKLSADMKAAARNYLQQLLKLDPERMQITAQGLVVN
jgi:hypothetical protein